MNSIIKAADCGQFINVSKDALKTIRSDYANWLIPGRVMCGPYPGLDGVNFPDEAAANIHLGQLVQDGINTFVCLQDEMMQLERGQPHPYFPKYANYANTLNKDPNIKFLYFPVKDQCCPGNKAFIDQMAQLCEAYMQGRNIYIHCAGGHGRTGWYAAALLMCLMRTKNMDAEYAMQFVQHVHDSRRIGDKRCHNMVFVASPNSNEQRQFVREFGSFLKFL
jgi:hypothetical protein